MPALGGHVPSIAEGPRVGYVTKTASIVCLKRGAVSLWRVFPNSPLKNSAGDSKNPRSTEEFSMSKGFFNRLLDEQT